MNNNKKIWMWVLGAVIVIIAAIILFGVSNESANNNNAGGAYNNSNSQAGVVGTGKVVFAVTDAAADIKNVTEIKMRVSRIEMHSETNGWVTVSDAQQEFNLLKLKADGKWQIAAHEDVAAGTYDQVRLIVSGVTVVKTDGSTASAKVPSDELKLNTRVTVKQNQTATVAVDVMGDLSLHLTGNGTYIFAPVVHVVSRADSNANIQSDNSVSISGGNVESDNNAGMDVNGEVKADFKIDNSVKLEVDL